MKLMQASLSAMEDQESSFHHCGCRASLLMCGKDLITSFYPPRRCSEARVGLFKCQRKSRLHFSPLCWSYEARASLFMCGNDLITPF